MIKSLKIQFFKLFKHFVYPFLSFFTFSHFCNNSFLSESSWLTIFFTKAIFCRKFFYSLLVTDCKLCFGVNFQSLHFFNQFLYFFLSLFFTSFNHFIDFIHLCLIPFNFRLIIGSPIFKKLTRF
jgi:hypothetical protein